MRDFRKLLSFIAILGCGCSQSSNAPVSQEPIRSNAKELTGSNLPLLRIKREEGDDALLQHKLTEDEQRIFRDMDAATANCLRRAIYLPTMQSLFQSARSMD
jgi:hypothetical protein